MSATCYATHKGHLQPYPQQFGRQSAGVSKMNCGRLHLCYNNVGVTICVIV